MPDNAATIAKLSDSELRRCREGRRVEEIEFPVRMTPVAARMARKDLTLWPFQDYIQSIQVERILPDSLSASTLGAVDRASEERVPRRDGVVRPWLNYAPPIRGKPTAQNVDMEEVSS